MGKAGNKRSIGKGREVWILERKHPHLWTLVGSTEGGRATCHTKETGSESEARAVRTIDELVARQELSLKAKGPAR